MDWQTLQFVPASDCFQVAVFCATSAFASVALSATTLKDFERASEHPHVSHWIVVFALIVFISSLLWFVSFYPLATIHTLKQYTFNVNNIFYFLSLFFCDVGFSLYLLEFFAIKATCDCVRSGNKPSAFLARQMR